MSVARDIGREIKAARVAAKMTQNRLGRRAGLAPRIVRLVEIGKANPTLNTLVKLGRALKRPFQCSLG
jgi:transcriptional regulator with XRE-family HTH domain